jgi:hypothetical protein
MFYFYVMSFCNLFITLLLAGYANHFFRLEDGGVGDEKTMSGVKWECEYFSWVVSNNNIFMAFLAPGAYCWKKMLRASFTS